MVLVDSLWLPLLHVLLKPRRIMRIASSDHDESTLPCNEYTETLTLL